MSDGSPMLAVGTYVIVDESKTWSANAYRKPKPPYVARITGTDLLRSKYEIGTRYAGWGRWLFLTGGGWASPRHITEISESQALESAGGDR